MKIIPNYSIEFGTKIDKQTNLTEQSPKTDPHMYIYLLDGKYYPAEQQEKDNVFAKLHKNWITTLKIKVYPYLQYIHKSLFQVDFTYKWEWL